MNIVYKSISRSILDAVRHADAQQRTIEKIELTRSEAAELMAECYMLVSPDVGKGKGWCTFAGVRCEWGWSA